MKNEACSKVMIDSFLPVAEVMAEHFMEGLFIEHVSVVVQTCISISDRCKRDLFVGPAGNGNKPDPRLSVDTIFNQEQVWVIAVDYPGIWAIHA